MFSYPVACDIFFFYRNGASSFIFKTKRPYHEYIRFIIAHFIFTQNQNVPATKYIPNVLQDVAMPAIRFMIFVRAIATQRIPAVVLGEWLRTLRALITAFTPLIAKV